MKTCPYCGEEVQDMDVLFHKCSAMREEEKKKRISSGKRVRGSMIPFLIAGIVGSSIFALLSIYTFVINTGVFDWGYLVLGIIFGLIGGSVGYLLFKLGGLVGNLLFKFPKTPPKLVTVGFYVISAILGLVFYFSIYSYLIMWTPTPPAVTPEPTPQLSTDDLWAINYVGWQESGPITLEIGRILVGKTSVIPVDISAYQWDTDVVGEIIFLIRNNGDKTVNVYPLMNGTLQIEGERIELWEYSSVSSLELDDVDGEIHPGVTKIGGLWFPIKRSQPIDIAEIIFRADYPVDSESYERLGSNFEIVIPIVEPGWQDYPEELH